MRSILGSVKREVHDAFSQFFGDLPLGNPPSAAAFCKARNKVKPGAFRELIKEVSRYFFKQQPQKPGMRLIAIDGSTVNLPETPQIRDFYGPQKKRPGLQGRPQARLSLCYEVDAGAVLDARLTTLKTGERKLARQHFRLLRPGDLVLMDMGYFGFDMLLTLLGTDIEFVMRVPPGSSTQVKEFVASGKESALISVVDGHRHDRVRAVRIELQDGTIEVLLTNLTSAIYDLDFFRDIYHRRWDVETFIGHLKNGYELENLSGLSPNKVQQEIYAKILACSLTCMLTTPLLPTLKRATRKCKLDYKFCMQDALHHTRDALINLLLAPAEKAVAVLQRLAMVLLQCRTPIRPGRSFPRNFSSSPPRYPANRKRI